MSTAIKIDNFLNAPNDSINFGDISKIKLIPVSNQSHPISLAPDINERYKGYPQNVPKHNIKAGNTLPGYP